MLVYRYQNKLTNRFTTRQREAIMAQLPESFVEKYDKATPSEKIILMNTFEEFLSHASQRKNPVKFLQDSLNININK